MTVLTTTSRIDGMIQAARARINRLNATEVPAVLRSGGYLVDIRPAAQRAAEGQVPGALVIERNVLEWRCDPTSEARLPQAVDDDVQWVILCSEGYTSSLAAAALVDLGLHRATDVIGGYHALVAAGVLVEPKGSRGLNRLGIGAQQRPEPLGFVRGPRRWM